MNSDFDPVSARIDDVLLAAYLQRSSPDAPPPVPRSNWIHVDREFTLADVVVGGESMTWFERKDGSRVGLRFEGDGIMVQIAKENGIRYVPLASVPKYK